jgi:hypothetical protein
MANYKSIAVVGQAIVKILTDSSRNEFPDAKFKMIQTTDLASNKGHPKEGVSVCLYYVNFNSELRTSPTRDPIGRPVHPPIPLRLSFLITPWSVAAERQARLLGWILHTMQNTPILSATFLNGIVSNEIMFSSDETVKLVYNPLSLSDLSLLLQNLKHPNVLSSVIYCASLVLGE